MTAGDPTVPLRDSDDATGRGTADCADAMATGHPAVPIPDRDDAVGRGTADRIDAAVGGGPAVPLPREQSGNPVPGSIPTIVRSYKSAATRRVNFMRGTPGAPLWQRNYYEHVVRNDLSLNRIRQYILDNPARWHDDDENPARAV